jgi:phenylacetate-CoA ligase
MDRFKLFENAKDSVEAYRDFLHKNGKLNVKEWQDIPIMDKHNYLLEYLLEKTVRDGEFDKCFLLGSSSGFSKTGAVFWPKRAEDEKNYLEAVEEKLKELYKIDKKRTLIVVSLAFGSWIGGMQIACTMRSLAARADYPITVATPGLNLKEAANLIERFKNTYEQFLWITNASNVPIAYYLLKHNKDLLNGRLYFPVVGEYFSEDFRTMFAHKFGHSKENPIVLWTGYGSADTGDLGIETKPTIKLRKYLSFENNKLCKELFNQEEAPMFFEKNPNAFIEIINSEIVVTKDQLVPLVRYNTKDVGGLLYKAKLKGLIPNDLFDELPEELLYVFGRVSDAIVFYGTNLTVNEIGHFLNRLDKKYLYAGLFDIEKSQKNGIELFVFTIYTLDDAKHLTDEYKDKLINFLKMHSNEFNAKYDNLKRASKMDLIEVKLLEIKDKQASIKHRFLKK